MSLPCALALDIELRSLPFCFIGPTFDFLTNRIVTCLQETLVFLHCCRLGKCKDVCDDFSMVWFSWCSMKWNLLPMSSIQWVASDGRSWSGTGPSRVLTQTHNRFQLNRYRMCLVSLLFFSRICRRRTMFWQIYSVFAEPL